MSLRIQELALPKGNISEYCEICGQRASTKCEKCKLTHYCFEYHKDVDFESFHTKVCDKIAFIRKKHPLPFTEEDRQEADNIILQKKREIQFLAEVTAKTWLLRENAEYAYMAAMSALNIAKDLEGSNSFKVIYPTCLVSESCLRLGDIQSAKSYMVQASWISQVCEIIPPQPFAQMKRLVGLICMSCEKWEEARNAFAECLYAISIKYGISDMHVAVAYGHLGLALLKFDKLEGAMASFHKMADNWLGYLLNQYKLKMLRTGTETEIAEDEGIRELEFQYMESRIVFRWVYQAVRKLGMNAVTDLINFKILCIQALSHIRDNCASEAVVYKHEALATATRTKQDKAVPKEKFPIMVDLLGEDYLLRWERKHNRPRTIATKYLEMIKAINV